MELIGLLGRRLKDDDVLDLLEQHDVEVIYDFDRTHENIPDCYWAPFREQGFQFRFDQNQILDVAFCYVEPSEGFSSIDADAIGAPVFVTLDEAESHCRAKSLKYQVSDAQNPGWWLRIETDTAWMHYQFKKGRVSLVTLSLPK